MFIRSEILHSPHAFATRRGGVSQLQHTSSLNLAFGRGDSEETVLKNLEIFADELGFDPHSVVSLPQIHSDKIFKVGTFDRGKGYYIRDGIEEGDGYITDEAGVVLGIKTADCVPILFEAEKEGRVVAVGATHAGWRGTVEGIAPKCVRELCREYNVAPESVRVAIGPCIHPCCYEVGGDLFVAVKEKLGEDIANMFVLPKEDKEGKYTCDLGSINEKLLVLEGVLPQNIDKIELCTCCNSDLFFSHRYSGGLRGTMLNVIFVQQ